MPRGLLGQALRTSGLGFSCFNLLSISGAKKLQGEGLYQEELQSRKAPEEIQKVGRFLTKWDFEQGPKTEDEKGNFELIETGSNIFDFPPTQ